MAVLLESDPASGLEAGDTGAVVHVYPDGAAYEVEFVTFTGHTAAIVTVEASKLRAVTSSDIVHVRQLISS